MISSYSTRGWRAGMSKLSVTCSTAFLAGLMRFAGTVHARELHAALDGIDCGSGSLDQPLQSIQKALNQAGPGDVVRIRGGVYRIKPLVLNRSGSRESPLAIEGMPGEEVILKGSQLVTGWQ